MRRRKVLLSIELTEELEKVGLPLGGHQTQIVVQGYRIVEGELGK
jgi:hypothetical protein